MELNLTINRIRNQRQKIRHNPETKTQPNRHIHYQHNRTKHPENGTY